MGHGCHDCGCPNGCECPEVEAERARMWGRPTPREVAYGYNPEHDSLFVRFEQLERMLTETRRSIPECEMWRASEALALVKLIRSQVLK